jgi:intraflagellar transport protein 122
MGLTFLDHHSHRKESAKRGETKANVNLGDYYAYGGRFQDAARNYQQAGAPDRAMAMFSDLRMFDQAKVKLVNQRKLCLASHPLGIHGRR